MLDKHQVHQHALSDESTSLSYSRRIYVAGQSSSLPYGESGKYKLVMISEKAKPTRTQIFRRCGRRGFPMQSPRYTTIDRLQQGQDSERSLYVKTSVVLGLPPVGVHAASSVSTAPAAISTDDADIATGMKAIRDAARAKKEQINLEESELAESRQCYSTVNGGEVDRGTFIWE